MVLHTSIIDVKHEKQFNGDRGYVYTLLLNLFYGNLFCFPAVLRTKFYGEIFSTAMHRAYIVINAYLVFPPFFPEESYSNFCTVKLVHDTLPFDGRQNF